MKNLKFIHTLVLAFALTGLVSCDKKEGPEEPVISDPDMLKGTLILNQGSYGMNNAGIAYFPTDDAETPFVSDIFYKTNNSILGDNATDIAKYKGNIYVSVTGSNCIYKLNGKGEVTDRILFHTDPELQGGVRFMTFKDDCVYASFYGGIVARLSASDLKIEAKLKTGGANLEGIAEVNGTIYVADSYQSTYDATTGVSDIVYSDKLYMIDPTTFTLKGTVKVALNPNKLLAANDKLFLISWGNYADKGYSFQMIEPSQGNKVTELGIATDMGIGNGKVYLLNSVTDWTTWATTNNWFSYDITSNRMDNTSFMKDAPQSLVSDHISMMAVDDNSGEIYIGTTRYTLGNGEVFRFGKDGKFETRSDCGGQNPIGALFL